MDKVVIAGPYNPAGKQIMQNRLEEHFEVISISSPEEFFEHPDANVVILRTIPLSGEAIRSMKDLKIIQRWGAGVDIIDVDTASERGIVVANVAGENGQAVAELTIGLLLAVYRRILTIDQALRRGEWIKSTIDKSCFMVSGKQVGIVGLGRIGRLVASMLLAFGANVQYYDIDATEDMLAFEKKNGLKRVSLEELLQTSDIVTLHIPLTPESHYLIDDAQLKLMKSNAVLLNVARGGIVNQEALFRALSEGRLLGAALDCFEEEPLPADSPLLKLDNVVLSCHVGGNTADLALRLAHRCSQNVLDYYEGKLDTRYIVNRNAVHFG